MTLVADYTLAPKGNQYQENSEERRIVMTHNLKAIIQLFGIKVHVFSERVGVRGGIPTQVLDLSEPQQEPVELLTSMASPEGKGNKLRQRGLNM